MCHLWGCTVNPTNNERTKVDRAVQSLLHRNDDVLKECDELSFTCNSDLSGPCQVEVREPSRVHWIDLGAMGIGLHATTLLEAEEKTEWIEERESATLEKFDIFETFVFSCWVTWGNLHHSHVCTVNMNLQLDDRYLHSQLRSRPVHKLPLNGELLFLNWTNKT